MQIAIRIKQMGVKYQNRIRTQYKRQQYNLHMQKNNCQKICKSGFNMGEGRIGRNFKILINWR